MSFALNMRKGFITGNTDKEKVLFTFEEGKTSQKVLNALWIQFKEIKFWNIFIIAQTHTDIYFESYILIQYKFSVINIYLI